MKIRYLMSIFLTVVLSLALTGALSAKPAKKKTVKKSPSESSEVEQNSGKSKKSATKKSITKKSQNKISVVKKAPKASVKNEIIQKASDQEQEESISNIAASPIPIAPAEPIEQDFFEGFTYIRDFKTLTQAKNGCGPAAVRMVVWHLTGNLLDEEQLSQDMRKNNIINTTTFGDKVGLTPVAMNYALDKFLRPISIVSSYKQYSDPNERLAVIKKSIDLGLPVVALVETLTRGLHWVVVIGYDFSSERLLFANSGGPLGVRRIGDSVNGFYETIPISEFIKTNSLSYGPLKNPLERLVLSLGSLSGMAEDLLIVLADKEVDDNVITSTHAASDRDQYLRSRER